MVLETILLNSRSENHAIIFAIWYTCFVYFELAYSSNFDRKLDHVTSVLLTIVPRPHSGSSTRSDDLKVRFSPIILDQCALNILLQIPAWEKTNPTAQNGQYHVKF